jgi:hypothetical protein
MEQKDRRPFRQALEGFQTNASGAFARVRRRPIKAALCLLTVGAAVAAIVFYMRRTPNWVGSSGSGIADLKQQAKQDPSSYERFRALGHAQFAAGRRAAAIKSYARALSLDEKAADETMLGNLAVAYGMNERAQADHLIARHHLLGMVPRLEQLANSHSHEVRWAAIGTLEKLGHASKVDYMHAYLVDLDASACEVRQHAVEKLGEIGAQRVDSALAAAKKRENETTPWYRSKCMGDRIDDAEKKIASRSPRPHKAAPHTTLAKK